MRPTNLGFRSPKERTAEFNLPKVTHDGRSLAFLQENQHPSLPLSRRFRQYEVAARRTTSQVGPGSYNLRKASGFEWSIPGTPIIRPYLALKDPSSNCYYFIGNHMVYDASFTKKKKKLNSLTFDISELRPVRLSSSNTPKREPSINKANSSVKVKKTDF